MKYQQLLDKIVYYTYYLIWYLQKTIGKRFVQFKREEHCSQKEPDT